jgi:phosphoenolpyruvate carboxykinase (GTP)
VDADGWKSAIPQIEEHFAKFGETLPAELHAQLQQLAASL